MRILESHILSDGVIHLFRQRADRPFTDENSVCIETRFKNLKDIPDVYELAQAKERASAARHPFLWHPEFGYISRHANICGTGLEIHGLFHLEGLFLIGDLPPVLKALEGARMNVVPMSGEGFKEAAHIFHIRNRSMIGISAKEITRRTGSIFSALVREEANARLRLVEELPRVLEDAISRALATLKNCRLLSEWELLDLLSPIALAAEFGFLTGISISEVRDMIRERLDMPESPRPQTYDDERDRDRKDAALADTMNLRFKSVRFNGKARSVFCS